MCKETERAGGGIGDALKATDGVSRGKSPHGPRGFATNVAQCHK